MGRKHVSVVRESWIRWTVVSAAVLALAGCGGGDVTESGPGNMQAVIYGTVTTAQGGSPLEGVEVVATPFGSNCMTQLLGGSFPATTTDENGEYGQTLTLPEVLGTTFDACLELDITPPPGAGLQATEIQNVQVQFRQISEIPPMDSVRVDAQL